MKSLAVLCLASAFSWAAELPEAVLPAGVGVNIHFTRGHEADLDMIAAAGFKFIRMDFGWGGTERQKGEYDWSAYDELTANLDKRGLRALYILDYSNSLYEETVTSRNPITGQEHKDTASPQHPESVAAFARWAAAAAAHFRGRHILWEIWNEPNISFWKPKPEVQQYNALALATCRAVRAADPQATIIGPATSGFPWPFLEDFFKSGALEHLDAVSVHPYRNYSQPPETAGEDYQKLRALIERYAATAEKKKMPILSGEWGYASHNKGVSLETQAAYIARQQLANLLRGVPLSIWYDWKNDGTDANEREHHFGTVTHDLKPKPAYSAIQTLTRELSGYRVTRRLDVGSDQDFVLLCANAAREQKLAAWTLAAPHPATIDLGLGVESKLPVVVGTVQSPAPKIEGKRLVLDLAPLPKYVPLGAVK
ncbi:MAG: cellulase family glycosylhydrolase [Chloroflexi bacterium]|nr:cellulase family glycosylhydrolase [Chloroflexota bacterium]